MKSLRIFALVPLAIIAGIAIYAVSNVNSLPARHMGAIESLHNPIMLAGWTDAGLITVDGRTLPIPNITHLPAMSDALTEATKRGVERAPDGRLTCLLRIHTQCGNDPILAQILRVDLADLLTYLQIGQPTAPIPNPQLLAREPGGRFDGDAGWNVSAHMGFCAWQSLKDSRLDP